MALERGQWRNTPTPPRNLNKSLTLSEQVLDPELEMADLAFAPSTVSASSLKMQVNESELQKS